jgi:hypothetical protein
MELGPANIDFPTVVNLTATFNGRTQTQGYTANRPLRGKHDGETRVPVEPHQRVRGNRSVHKQ